MKKLLLLAGLIAYLAAGNSLTAGANDTLNWCIHAEPQSLDPQVATGVPEGRVIGALYEGLTGINQKTLKPIPAAAESWSLSPDKLTYTFKIRKATWSNGDPITAQDFVDSWQRMMRLKPVSLYVSMMYKIKGAKDYADRNHDDFSKVALKVIDEHTLSVTLEGPTPYFLELTAHYSYFPVHDAKNRHAVDVNNQKPGNLISNGAYKLKEHYQEEKIIVVKRDDYWDAANVKINAIKFLPIDNIDTAYKGFLAGNIDILNDVPLSKLEDLMDDSSSGLRIAPYLGTYYYRFNCSKPPFNDKRVRQAFCHAIFKKRITKKISGAGEIPAGSMIPQGLPGITPDEGYGYDKKRAKELLAEAGYPGGQGFPEIELLFNTSESHEKIALEVARHLNSILGITVKPKNQEWKTYLDKTSKLDYTFARAGWIGDYSDPTTFLELMRGGDGNNRTGWANEEFDNLIAEAGLLEGAPRMAKLKAAEKILTEEAPILPIYTYVSKTLISKRVLGWKDNILNRHNAKDLSLMAR